MSEVMNVGVMNVGQSSRPVVHGCSVTFQRHRHSGNMKVLRAYLPTYLLTGVGSRVALISKMF